MHVYEGFVISQKKWTWQHSAQLEYTIERHDNILHNWSILLRDHIAFDVEGADNITMLLYSSTKSRPSENLECWRQLFLLKIPIRWFTEGQRWTYPCWTCQTTTAERGQTLPGSNENTQNCKNSRWADCTLLILLVVNAFNFCRQSWKEDGLS